MKTLITLLLLTFASTAMADGTNLSGSFIGFATQTPADLNGDGEYARNFQVRIHTADRHGDDQFIEAQGLIDSGIAQNPKGTCPAGAFELEVHGEVYWNTRGGDRITAAFRPDEPLCFTPGQTEAITLDIIGGRGLYADASGTIDVVLDDQVRLVDPASAIGLPAVVDTLGTYVIHLD